MKVGIVAEGPADVAVLMNILHGALGVERKDVLPIRPELTLDETDLAEKRRGGYRPPKPEEFGNWALVLEECRERTRLADFLDSPKPPPGNPERTGLVPESAAATTGPRRPGGRSSTPPRKRAPPSAMRRSSRPASFATR